MCDTFVIRKNGATFFGKNSDREPGEPQYLIRFPAITGDTSPTVKTTYLEIPQVADRHGLILSSPSWIWGGEIGINDHGVVIGNEAIFSRLVMNKGHALLGMDLLRLGLERGGTARQALEVMVDLLQQFGQGGPAGFRDKSFRYDNSFIIADARQAWVLETAGRHWVARSVEAIAAISNQLTIGTDYDIGSPELMQQRTDFRRQFDTRFMPAMGAAPQRRQSNLCRLQQLSSGSSIKMHALAEILRSHGGKHKDFSRHGLSLRSNADVCMHAGGLLRPSQTTASMLVKLQGNAQQIYGTATSAPCLSLFKPIDWELDCDWVFDAAARPPEKESCWYLFESVHRYALFNMEFRRELRRSRDELEQQVWASPDTGSVLLQKLSEWHQFWYRRARQEQNRHGFLSGYERFWRKHNRLDGIGQDRQSVS